MPLRKLWNSLCGRPTLEPKEIENTEPQSSVKQTSAKKANATTPEKTAGPRLATLPTSNTKGNEVTTKPARNRFGFGGERNAEPLLCKLLAPLKITSILEVGVDDGSRAIAVVNALHAANPETKLRYCAIDSFEMGDGSVTLMQFHQRVRAEGVNPQIFPDSIENGLIRVVHTVGLVDVVLLGVSKNRWDNDVTISKLQRVCHAGTAVFYSEGGKWHRWTDAAVTSVRRAA